MRPTPGAFFFIAGWRDFTLVKNKTLLMELAIIFLVVAILGFFLWRSYANNKAQNPSKGPDRSNPNPNAPTSSKRM